MPYVAVIMIVDMLRRVFFLRRAAYATPATPSAPYAVLPARRAMLFSRWLRVVDAVTLRAKRYASAELPIC